MEWPLPNMEAIDRLNEAIRYGIAAAQQFRRAAIRHGHIAANPRTRYQPCARYSRHPRYQPKHPDEPHANTSTSNVAPTVLPPATSAEK